MMGTVNKENIKPTGGSNTSRQRSASRKSLTDTSVNVSKVGKAKLKNIKDKRSNQRLARLEKVCSSFFLQLLDVLRPFRNGTQE
jgi:hypothetical protein